MATLRPNTSQLDIIVNAEDRASETFKKMESGIIRFVGAVSSLLSVFTAVAYPIKQAAEFEAELINVAKTTDFTSDQIGSLRKSLVELSTQIDVSSVDLAKIAATAGQLGLGGAGVRGIQAFTETTARFASVVDITVEESANGLARLLNIFKVNVEEAERISSLLNELSNNSTASGADLIDMIQRIGTAGGVLNAKTAGALAATGRDLGLSLETVGTSFNKIFLSLQSDADKIAPKLGKTVAEFSQMLQTDGIGALKLYTKTLAQMDEQSRATFIQQSSGGGRIFSLVTNLVNDAANNFELLDKHLASAQRGFDGGTSALREQERVMQGFIKQLTLVRNGLINIAEEIGRRALPFLSDLAKELQTFLSDPRIRDNFIEFGRTLGNFLVGMVEFGRAAINVVAELRPLFELIKLLIGVKLVTFFLGVASSIYQSARNSALAVVQFRNLITGTAQAVAAEAALKTAIEARAASQAKANALSEQARARSLQDQTTRLGPGAVFLGALVGGTLTSAAGLEAEAERKRVAVQNELIRAKALELNIQKEVVRLSDVQTLNSLKAAAVEKAIATERRALAIELATRLELQEARQTREVLRTSEQIALMAQYESVSNRSNAAKIAYLQDEIRNRNVLIAQQREQAAMEASITELLRQQAQQQAVTAAARRRLAEEAIPRDTRNAAQRAIGAVGDAASSALFTFGTFSRNITNGVNRTLTGVIGSFTGGLVMLGRTAAVWGSRIISVLLGPWVTIPLLIIGLVAPYWESIRNWFTDLVGLSSETTRRAEQDTRIRAREAEKEAENIRNLAAEYDSLSKSVAFKRVTPTILSDPAQQNKFGENFRNITRQTELIAAKIRSVVVELEEAGELERVLLSDTTRAGIAYERQVRVVEELAARLAELNKVDPTSPASAAASATKTRIEVELEKARLEADRLEQSLNKVRGAWEAAMNARGDTADQIPNLLKEYETRIQAVTAVSSEETLALLRQAQAVADVKTRLEDLRKTRGKYIDEALKPGASVEERRAGALDVETAKSLQAQLTARVAEFEEGMRKASVVAARVIRAQIPDILKAQASLITPIVSSTEAILTGSVDDYIAKVAEGQRELEKMNAELDKLRDRRAIQERSGSSDLGTTVFEIQQLTSKIALKKSEIELDNVGIEVARRAIGSESQRAATTRELTLAELQNVAALGQRYVALEAQERAQRALARAARNDATAYASMWQRAKNEAEAAVVNGLRFAADAVERAKNRTTTIRLAVFDVDTSRAQRQLNFALKLYGDYRREQIENSGYSPEEKARQLAILDQQIAAEQEAFQKGRETARIQKEYQLAQDSARETAARIAASQEQQRQIIAANEAIEKDIAEATRQGRGQEYIKNRRIEQAELRRRLLELEAAGEAQRATLERAQTRMQELGETVVSGEFTGVFQPIDPAQLEKDMTKTNEVLITYKQAREAIFDSVKKSTEDYAQSQESALKVTQDKLKEIAKEADVYAKAMAVNITTMLTNIGNTFLKSNEQLAGMVETANRLAGTRFDNVFEIPNIAARFAEQGEATQRAIDLYSRQWAETMQANGFGSDRATLLREIKLEFNLQTTKADIEEFTKRAQEELNTRRITIRDMVFPSAPDKLQEAIDTKEYTANVKFKTTEGGAVTGIEAGRLVGLAGGGFIEGPGTSTSDSILARLSRGEFVSDARTVRMFGPGFFQFLKSISTRGPSSVAAFLDKLSLPKFAAGGFVNVAGLAGAGAGAGGSVDTVRVELSIGPSNIPVYTDREKASELVRVLKSIGRAT